MLFAKAEQNFNFFQIIKGNFYFLVKFALYLVCVYWSTQAFIKYQSEPAITTIKYEFDENQQGHLSGVFQRFQHTGLKGNKLIIPKDIAIWEKKKKVIRENAHYVAKRKSIGSANISEAIGGFLYPGT